MYYSPTIRHNIWSIGDAVRRYFCSTRGATSLEYAVVACLLSIAIIGSVWMVGNAAKSNYEAVASGISPESVNINKAPDSCQQGGVNCGSRGRGNK